MTERELRKILEALDDEEKLQATMLKATFFKRREQVNMAIERAQRDGKGCLPPLFTLRGDERRGY